MHNEHLEQEENEEQNLLFHVMQFLGMQKNHLLTWEDGKTKDKTKDFAVSEDTEGASEHGEYRGAEDKTEDFTVSIAVPKS